MEVERTNEENLTPEEQAHLAKLRKLVQGALADGKVSEAEIQSVREFIHADKQVTVAELNTIKATIREILGDAYMEYGWG